MGLFKRTNRLDHNPSLIIDAFSDDFSASMDTTDAVNMNIEPANQSLVHVLNRSKIDVRTIPSRLKLSHESQQPVRQVVQQLVESRVIVPTVSTFQARLTKGRQIVGGGKGGWVGWGEGNFPF